MGWTSARGENVSTALGLACNLLLVKQFYLAQSSANCLGSALIKQPVLQAIVDVGLCPLYTTLDPDLPCGHISIVLNLIL